MLSEAWRPVQFTTEAKGVVTAFITILYRWHLDSQVDALSDRLLAWLEKVAQTGEASYKDLAEFADECGFVCKCRKRRRPGYCDFLFTKPGSRVKVAEVWVRHPKEVSGTLREAFGL